MISPNAPQQTFALSSGYFVRTNDSTVTLTRSGFDGYCHVEVGNGISQRVVSFSSNKTMDLSVAGPGGLHPDYVEQASTVYTIYLAWNSGTSPIDGTIALFSVPSGTAIDAAKLTGLGGGYDYVSCPIGYVRNNSGSSILFFAHTGPWWLTSLSNAPVMLSTGKATVATAIPITAYVPAEASKYIISIYSNNTVTANQPNLQITANGAGISQTVIYFTASGYDICTICRNCIVPIVKPVATSLQYAYLSSVPSSGLSVYLYAVYLGSSPIRS